MIFDIECPNPAYERLRKTGICKRILDKKQEISDIHINTHDLSEGLLAFAKKEILESQTISDRKRLFENIIQLQEDISQDRYFIEREGHFLKNPSYLAYIVLGDEVLNYNKYGFPTRRSLEQAIASFCIGESHLFRLFNDTYVWRQGKLKNTIYHDTHGDLYAHQVDVSGKDYQEETLFGKIPIFDTIKENCRPTGINGYQDWSEFLMSILRYAEVIQKHKIPEITNWKDVLDEVGSVGTNTTEGMFGESNIEMYLRFLFEAQILTSETKELREFPLQVNGTSSGYCFIPYVKDRKLMFLLEDKEGDIKLNFQKTIFEEKNYRKVLEYQEKDLPHILRANYRFFARDRRKMHHIMDFFNQETLIKN